MRKRIGKFGGQEKGLSELEVPGWGQIEVNLY